MNPDEDDDRTGTEDAGARCEDAEARRAEERFIDDLISRGEAVPAGQELPPGATHEIVCDDQGRRTARRVRFKAF
jgi:hypothetical protein